MEFKVGDIVKIIESGWGTCEKNFLSKIYSPEESNLSYQSLRVIIKTPSGTYASVNLKGVKFISRGEYNYLIY